MGDPISSLVDIIVKNQIDLSRSLIIGEYNLVEGVRQEVERLESNLTAIEAVLKTAEEKQLEETHLRDWLGKLKNVVWDAEDVLDTFKTDVSLWKRKQEVRCFQPPFSLSKTSYEYDAAHRIKGISSKLKSIVDERRFHLDIKVDDGRPRNDIPTCSYVEADCVFGREDDKKRLVDLLLSDESEKQRKVSLIPIIGMGGIGKTTLARLVYNDSSVEKNFEFRMWVCVPAQFDLTWILREMMNPYLKMPLSVDLSSSLVKSRFREFLSGKRFLLVLDDVWSVDYNKDWNPLLQLLEMGKKGSKVIVTTQNQKIAEIVDAQSLHMLERLPENECWSLFKNSAFRSGNLSSSMQKDLEDIGKEIVRKCDGLPLAVKAMGDLLQGNVDVSKWRKVMNSSMKEIEDSNLLNILSTLKLSYNYLPSHLKQCFAFCSIFPKAYVFDKEELVKLWMAQSFIQPRGIDRVEKIGIEYFDELLARSFFQVSNIHSKVQYRMHDLIHDLAQSVSSTYCCQVKDIKSCSFSEDYRHMSLLCQDVEQSLKIVDSSIKLRTLLLPGDRVKDFGEALGKMFHTLKYIRVLDLSSSALQKLPNSIKELKLLRYLDLSKTDIKVLPDSVCNLYNLQTLKMLGCPGLFALPKDLWKLVNLHYLELDDIFWFKCEALPPRIGKLTNLHNMLAFRVGCKTGYGIEELKDMAYLTGTLHISMLENAGNAKEAKLNEKESLQKLVFEWSNKDINQHDEAAGERILEDLLPHSNIKELQICNYIGIRFPTWMRDGRLQNLLNVTLNNCTKTKTLTLGQLPHLEALNIEGLQELEEWPNVQCLSLHRLKLYDCPKLIKLPDIFHKLGILKIKRCNLLKVLPVTPCLESLMVVDNSSLEDWNELTMPFECEGEKSSLSKLAELTIVNCPKISALPQDFSLKKLEISMCELLTIPSTEHMQHLQHLSLDTCSDGILLGLVTYASSLYSLIISNIANLVSFPKWPHLPELKALYIHSCKELVSLSQDEEPFRSLTSLKVLSIKDCPNLVTLPDEGLPASLEYLSIISCAGLDSLGPKGMLKSLTSLRDLCIQDCPLIHSFPEDGLPASLQHLHVQNCPLLTERCQKENGGGPEWPKIMNIPDLEIDSTKMSTPDSTSWSCNFFCGRAWWSSVVSHFQRIGDLDAPRRIACFCWALWKQRNLHLFQNQNIEASRTIHMATQYGQEYLIPVAIIVPSNSTEFNAATSWQPPNRDVIKINVDASFNYGTGVAGLSVLFRNAQGRLIDGVAVKKKTRTPLSAEAEALVLALKHAKVAGYEKIVVESDCKGLVQAFSVPIENSPWEIRSLLLLAKELFVFFLF